MASAMNGNRRWERYPAYKDSGVEWLGEIPTWWDVVPLKSIAPVVTRGNGPEYVEGGGIPVVNQACIYWDGLHAENVRYHKLTDVSGYKGLLRPWDLLVNSTGTGTLGRAVVFNEDGVYIADSHVTIVRLNLSEIDARYVLYLVSTGLYQGFVYAALVSGSTNQIELSREGLRATPVVVPPLSEQQAITAFLDRETARIDVLVAKQRRLVELLQEKRTALIQRAVTKGLDPSVPMKDSGVEWLGEIPTGWKAVKLRWLSEKISSGKTPLGGSEVYSEEGVIFIRSQNVYDNGLRLDDVVHISDAIDEDMRATRVRAGDVLLNITGASIGRSCLVPHGFPRANVNQHVCIVRAKTQVTPDFLAYCLKAAMAKDQIQVAQVGSSREGLSYSDAGDLIVVLPFGNLSMQHAIVSFLDRETAKIDTLVVKVAEAIERLREYRSALISAAVTGKIDVREPSAG